VPLFRITLLLAFVLAPSGVVHALPLPADVTPSVEPLPADVTPNAQPLPTSMRTLIHDGRFGDALTLADRLLARKPDDGELRVVRARLLFWLGRPVEAQTEAQALHERHPDDLEVIELLAQIRLAGQDSANALRLYRLLEAAGDRRPEIHQRVIDLQFQMGDAAAVRASLHRGGQLSDEQEMALARVEHPWFADAGTSQTLYDGQVWPRLEGAAGYRFSPNVTLLAGAMAEQRGTFADPRRGFGAKTELYFARGRLSGMLPSGTFLPLIDTRGDVSVQATGLLALGAYVRYAHYTSTIDKPVDAVTLSPNVLFSLGSWSVQPGYMFVAHHTGGALPLSRLQQTGYLKLRWQPTAPTAVFLSTFVGQDPSILERNVAADLSKTLGVSVGLGVDHWWTGRFGTRASISRAQPYGDALPYTEFSLVLRGRL
jgi:antitoxin component HigA of HigAB toxin-antitoxin module